MAVLKNFKLTSLKTLISTAAPLSAGVQLMLHKKYNTDGRTVHITQGMLRPLSPTTHVSDTNDSGGHDRVRHDRIVARRFSHDAFGRV